jgi:hypothetical protein
MDLSGQQVLAKESCPACFGPTSDSTSQPLTNQTTPCPPSNNQSTSSEPSRTPSSKPNQNIQSQPSTNTRSSTLQPLIICLDGNFQHRHHFAASKNYIDLITPNKFISPDYIEEVDNSIQQQERLHNVRTTVSNTHISFKSNVTSD